jgi:hypothetical protein
MFRGTAIACAGCKYFIARDTTEICCALFFSRLAFLLGWMDGCVLVGWWQDNCHQSSLVRQTEFFRQQKKKLETTTEK